jgi:integrase
MPVRRRRGSPYWQIRFQLAGREIRSSTRTTDRGQAEQLEEELRRRYWRQVKLGEKQYTWDDAVERCQAEDRDKRSWERTARALARLSRLLDGAPLKEITRDNVLRIREIRRRQVAASTVNRELAVLRFVLNRCVTDWGMLDLAPKVPLFRLERMEPRWATREQVHALLALLPPHSRDMTILACATGLRRSNITGLEWSRVDIARCTAFIPATQAKGRRAIAVPLNADALAVLERWRGKHERFVFSFRQRAPIKQVSTRKWRECVTAVGMAGFRFHDLRHTWASWQVQAETPLSHLQELGGWSSFSMVQRYAHLSPGHLKQYADRTLLGADAGSDSAIVPRELERKSRKGQ